MAIIRVKIKVKNDHRSITEDFEAAQLLLSDECETIRNWVEKVIKDFNEPVDEVTLKASMVL